MTALSLINRTKIYLQVEKNQMKTIKKLKSSSTAMKTLTLAISGILSVIPLQASAHGYVEFPKARQAFCEEQGGYWWPADGSNIPNVACREAFLVSGHYPFTQKPEFAANVADYDNQAAVEAVVTDGTLCAGGDANKAGLNLPHAQWQRTEITPNANGQIKLRYRANTPHNPSFWKFYLSKPGFDAHTNALTWADVDLVQEHDNIDLVLDADGRRFYEMYVSIPAGRDGDAILFSRWQRNDAGGEGFYNCSDVTIKDSGPVDDIWYDAGFYVKQGQEANVGDSARMRLFSKEGQELINQVMKITADNVNGWQKTLADMLVFDHPNLLSIGVKNASDEVVFDAVNLTANKIWVHDADHTFNLTVAPAPPNSAPNVNDIANITMNELGVEQIHVHAFDDDNDSISYTFNVPSAFTSSVDGPNLSLVAPKVTTDTDYTISVSVSDGKLSTDKSFTVTVKNLSAAAWSVSKTYVGGDQATHNGKLYKAKWWTLGEEPGSAQVWEEVK